MGLTSLFTLSRILNTYLVTLKRTSQLQPAQKTMLTKFVEERLAKVHGDASALADRWSLGTEDVLALKKVLNIA